MSNLHIINFSQKGKKFSYEASLQYLYFLYYIHFYLQQLQGFKIPTIVINSETFSSGITEGHIEYNKILI